MRILVLSDSHGSAANCERALRLHRTADWLIHLGDGERDTAPFFPMDGVPLLQVRGNCDFYSTLPSSILTGLRRTGSCAGILPRRQTAAPAAMKGCLPQTRPSACS